MASYQSSLKKGNPSECIYYFEFLQKTLLLRSTTNYDLKRETHMLYIIGLLFCEKSVLSSSFQTFRVSHTYFIAVLEIFKK